MLPLLSLLLFWALSSISSFYHHQCHQPALKFWRSQHMSLKGSPGLSHVRSLSSTCAIWWWQWWWHLRLYSWWWSRKMDLCWSMIQLFRAICIFLISRQLSSKKWTQAMGGFPPPPHHLLYLYLYLSQAMGGFPPPHITWWIGTRQLQPQQTVTKS